MRQAATISTKKTIFKYYQIYLFLIPAVIHAFIFNYVPLFGITMAFRDYSFSKGLFFSPWIGFKYFQEFFNYYNFWVLIKNTFIISFFKLVLFYPLPIIFALMLNEVRSSIFKRVLQTISYLPHFISWIVAVIIFQQFLSLDGFINQIRVSIGLEKIFFMNDSNYFYPIMFLSHAWKNIGWNSIIFIAALSNTDPALYEAARMDGANRFRQIWHISLPSIAQTAVILFVLGLASIMSAGWEQIYLLRTPGNMQLADILDTYVIEQGLKGGHFGYATSVSLFQSVIGITLVLSTNKIVKKLSDISLF